MSNLFITGKSGSGKSYLVSQLMHQIIANWQGFTTSHLYDHGTVKGYQLHSLQEIAENDQWIMRKTGDHKEIFPEVFEDLGLRILQSISEPYIVMDELGCIEANAPSFQKAVVELLESDAVVLCVLKKEEIPWFTSFSMAAGDLDLDLDSTPYEVALQRATQWLLSIQLPEDE